jgi:phytoene synthase
MTPEQYCQKKIQASRSNFSFAFFFLSKQRRLGLNALYAFCREVDDIVDEERGKKDKKEKLNKWREEITLLFQKKTAASCISRTPATHRNIYTSRTVFY